MNIDQNNHSEVKRIKEEESASSSEDDENAVLLTDDLEEKFFKLLSRLKKKDSNLYSENINYFKSEESKGRAKHLDQEDYKEWLKGQKKKIEDSETKKELKALHDFWTNPATNKDEKFLRDYILDKRFLEHDDSFCLEDELKKLSEEEEEEQRQTIFEEKYNCRFENSDEKFLQKYPRTMKKASGEKEVSNSFTESEEIKSKNMSVKVFEPKIKEHGVRNLITKEQAGLEKKRKSTDTSASDLISKMIKSEITGNIYLSKSQRKRLNKLKNKSLNFDKNAKDGLRKEQKRKDDTAYKRNVTEIKTGILKTSNFQALNRKENINLNDTNEIKKSKHEKVYKNVTQVKKLEKIHYLKDKNQKKYQKKKLHKKQNIKQPLALKKSEKKAKGLKRKPRHRSLQSKKLP